MNKSSVFSTFRLAELWVPLRARRIDYVLYLHEDLTIVAVAAVEKDQEQVLHFVVWVVEIHQEPYQEVVDDHEDNLDLPSFHDPLVLHQEEASKA